MLPALTVAVETATKARKQDPKCLKTASQRLLLATVLDALADGLSSQKQFKDALPKAELALKEYDAVAKAHLRANNEDENFRARRAAAGCALAVASCRAALHKYDDAGDQFRDASNRYAGVSEFVPVSEFLNGVVVFLCLGVDGTASIDGAASMASRRCHRFEGARSSGATHRRRRRGLFPEVDVPPTAWHAEGWTETAHPLTPSTRHLVRPTHGSISTQVPAGGPGGPQRGAVLHERRLLARRNAGNHRCRRWARRRRERRGLPAGREITRDRARPPEEFPG